MKSFADRKVAFPKTFFADGVGGRIKKAGGRLVGAEFIQTRGGFVDQGQTRAAVRLSRQIFRAARRVAGAASSQRVRTGPSRQAETSESKTSKACDRERRNFHFPARSDVAARAWRVFPHSRLTNAPESLPSQRARSARVAGSSGTVSPVSVKTKRSASRRPLGCSRGASSAAVSGSALIAAATPCAVQRSRKVSRPAMPGSGEKARLAIPGSTVPQPCGSELAQAYHFSRRPAAGKEQMAFACAQAFLAWRQRNFGVSRSNRSRTPLAAKTR